MNLLSTLSWPCINSSDQRCVDQYGSHKGPVRAMMGRVAIFLHSNKDYNKRRLNTFLVEACRGPQESYYDSIKKFLGYEVKTFSVTELTRAKFTDEAIFEEYKKVKKLLQGITANNDTIASWSDDVLARIIIEFGDDQQKFNKVCEVVKLLGDQGYEFCWKSDLAEIKNNLKVCNNDIVKIIIENSKAWDKGLKLLMLNCSFSKLGFSLVSAFLAVIGVPVALAPLLSNMFGDWLGLFLNGLVCHGSLWAEFKRRAGNQDMLHPVADPIIRSWMSWVLLGWVDGFNEEGVLKKLLQWSFWSSVSRFIIFHGYAGALKAFLTGSGVSKAVVRAFVLAFIRGLIKNFTQPFIPKVSLSNVLLAKLGNDIFVGIPLALFSLVLAELALRCLAKYNMQKTAAVLSALALLAYNLHVILSYCARVPFVRSLINTLRFKLIMILVNSGPIWAFTAQFAVVFVAAVIFYGLYRGAYWLVARKESGKESSQSPSIWSLLSCLPSFAS